MEITTSYADYLKLILIILNPQTAMMGGLDLTSVRPGTYYLRTEPQSPFFYYL